MTSDPAIREDAAPAGTAAVTPVERPLERRAVVRVTVVVWVVALGFAAIAVARSQHLDIPLRDPDGVMFRGRLRSAVLLLVALALMDAVGRTATPRGWSFPGIVRHLRGRWTGQRLFLVASALLAYHVVYVSYRNLKSWNAFNTQRDRALLDLEQGLFLGHHPAALLHDLLGTQTSAVVLMIVYKSFTYLVTLSVVGTLALLPRIREAYVMVCAGIWVWILGLGSYYLIPTLGPFASAPQEFADLRSTRITRDQAEYLHERAHLLADPSAGDAFASISAFASLHVAFTCTVLLVVHHYGWRRTTWALGVYLTATMVATVYFGWHFVVDDLAGVLVAALAVALGLWMAGVRRRRRDGAAAA